MKKILYSTGMFILLLLLSGCKTPPPGPEIMTPAPTSVPTPVPTPVPTQVPIPTPERPYYIEVIPPKVAKDYRINPYSFVHSFYSFIFYDFDLISLIPFNERIDIMKIIYNEVLPGSQVNFIIKKYLNVDKLSFVFYTVQENSELILHLRTNYDSGAAVLVPLDMPKEEWKRCVSVSYYEMDSHLIHMSDLYSPGRENDLLETRQYVDLAHFYIFDENKENDEQVETILNNIISRNTKSSTVLRASCELAYFYLLHERIGDAEAVIERAASLIEDQKPNGTKRMYELLVEEFEIMKTLME